MSDDLSLQSTERGCQGIDASDPRERTRRVRNGGHVLYCWGIRRITSTGRDEHVTGSPKLAAPNQPNMYKAGASG
jgi:hypothetical protein